VVKALLIKGGISVAPLKYLSPKIVPLWERIDCLLIRVSTFIWGVICVVVLGDVLMEDLSAGVGLEAEQVVSLGEVKVTLFYLF
jgi:hypothetical protein